MSASVRPPDQYLTVPGTAYCLQSNEYNRNIYGECNYVGNRTLIKCKQIRRKEDLLRNNGQCEHHAILRSSLKRRFTREKARLSLEGGKKKKYDPVLFTEECVSEEEDALMPAEDWPPFFPDDVYMNAPDDDQIAPLRYAGVYTDKEVARIRIALLKKEIEQLERVREWRRESALREVDKVLEPQKTKKKLIPYEGEALRLYKAQKSYFTMNTQTKRLGYMRKRVGSPPLNRATSCLHGCNSNNDAGDVRHVVNCLLTVVDKGAEYADVAGGEPCTRYALPGADYCIAHLPLNSRKSLMTKCEICSTIVLADESDTPMGDRHRNLCPLHRKVTFFTRPSSSASNHAVIPYKSVSLDDSDSDLQNEEIDELLKSARKPQPQFGPSRIRVNQAGMRFAAATGGGNRGQNSPSSSPLSPSMPISPAAAMATLNPANLSAPMRATLNIAKQKKKFDDSSSLAARCRPFDRAHFPPKSKAVTHYTSQASAAAGPGRPPGSSSRHPPRVSLPCNPPGMPRIASSSTVSSLAPIPRISSTAASSSHPSHPQPIPPFQPAASRANNMRARGGSSRGHHNMSSSHSRDAVQQRRQMEEDQKAANSILDDSYVDNLVEDTGSGSRSPALGVPLQRQPTGPVVQRFSVPANKRGQNQMPRNDPRYGNSGGRVVQYRSQPQQQLVRGPRAIFVDANGESFSRPIPPQFTTTNDGMGHSGGMPTKRCVVMPRDRDYRMPSGSGAAGGAIAPGNNLPPEMQNKTVREVITMQQNQKKEMPIHPSRRIPERPQIPSPPILHAIPTPTSSDTPMTSSATIATGSGPTGYSSAAALPSPVLHAPQSHRVPSILRKAESSMQSRTGPSASSSSVHQSQPSPSSHLPSHPAHPSRGTWVAPSGAWVAPPIAPPHPSPSTAALPSLAPHRLVRHITAPAVPHPPSAPPRSPKKDHLPSVPTAPPPSLPPSSARAAPSAPIGITHLPPSAAGNNTEAVVEDMKKRVDASIEPLDDLSSSGPDQHTEGVANSSRRESLRVRPKMSTPTAPLSSKKTAPGSSSTTLATASTTSPSRVNTRRRSERLEKSISEDSSKDPLSMLADVSAAMSSGGVPAGGQASSEEEFEEEL